MKGRNNGHVDSSFVDYHTYIDYRWSFIGLAGRKKLMGCDIHVHTEVKINGEWHHLGNPNVGRHYALFAKMANVRNRGDITPIAEPRGLPDDITFLTRFDKERDGGHSYSYLTGEEIDQLDVWYRQECKRFTNDYCYIEKEFGYLFSGGWNVKKYPDDQPDGVEDSRWVFWFDN